jgi:hypothetical protein
VSASPSLGTRLSISEKFSIPEDTETLPGQAFRDLLQKCRSGAASRGKALRPVGGPADQEDTAVRAGCSQYSCAYPPHSGALMGSHGEGKNVAGGNRPMNAQPDGRQEPGAPPDLRRHYRAIGIEAVVAALRYRSEPRNDAYAPAKPRTARERFEDAAA